MTTRCRPGDLAVIIRDEPGYEDNIGRIVRVHGPARLCEELGLTWLIVPLSEHPYGVRRYSGKRADLVVKLGHVVEHPDAWMEPIRPDPEQVLQALIDTALVDSGAVLHDT